LQITIIPVISSVTEIQLEQNMFNIPTKIFIKLTKHEIMCITD